MQDDKINESSSAISTDSIDDWTQKNRISEEILKHETISNKIRKEKTKNLKKNNLKNLKKISHMV